MKSKNVIILILVSLLFISIVKADTVKEDPDKVRDLSYSGYLMLSKTAWEEGIKVAKSEYNNSPDNMELLFKLVRVRYGLLYSCMANQDKETYKEYIEQTEELADKLLEQDEKCSKAHALRAGIYSVKLAFNPLMGMFLGPKSDEHIENAIKYDENEPTAWVRKAGSKYWTPEMFGGNKNDAIKYFEKAIELFEKDEKEIYRNWEYLDALAWLGIAYKDTGQKEKAIQTFKKALEVEPAFNWIKYSLLPDIEGK